MASGRLSIAVIGLGYVGLPVAVALARQFDVIGFDIDSGRIAELRDNEDRCGEVATAELRDTSLAFTSDPADCAGRDLYIVAVPTPVDSDNRPDLAALDSATRTVAGMVDPALRPTIVYESTVYPGLTEDHCGKVLADCGLVRGRDFRLGYSPERINPGDKVHRVETIVKVVAGEDEEVARQLEQVYGAVTSAGTFRAASIRTAEAAKVIENAQRDINVAFMNEVARIMAAAGVSVWDVLDAARTKWNFLPFEPGLVGGHCIGVDPFYLAHLAEEVGHHPQVVLAGRSINDRMGCWIADQLHRLRATPGTALIMGLTFKEDVPDLRNSRSIDLFRRLSELGHDVAVADPHADAVEIADLYGQRPVDPAERTYDLVVGAVRHDSYRTLDRAALDSLAAPGGLVADIKGMWRNHRDDLVAGYWTL